ncbi:MAG: nuclear transport factor 2 family protein [Candidatus Thorarchaeota archaeon]
MSEIERVKEAVRAYVDGVVEFNFSKGENAWHPKGLKISYDSESQQLKQYTISETRPDLTADEIEVMKQRISQKGTILSAEYSGDAASVKLVWNFKKDEVEKEITDYILLLRIDGDWKIVAKVFNQ